jgi:hypothetical protein
VPAGQGNVNAHFLPFDLRAFDYSCRSEFTRPAQEPAFKLFNLGVLAIEQDLAQKSPGHAAPALVSLIRGWYGNDLGRATQRDEFVPEGWRDAGATNLLSLTGQAYLYRHVVATSCRSCHVSRESSRNLDFGSFINFHSWATNTRSAVFGNANLAQSVISMNPDSVIRMPLARRTFQRFWNSTSPRPAAEILRDYLLGRLSGFGYVPRITAADVFDSSIRIQFTTAFGGSYSVERTSDLNSPVWSSLEGSIAGISGITQVVEPLPPGHPKNFYRVLAIEP